MGERFFYLTDEFTTELANQIQSEAAYVNVHTVNNPNGEVRGQIVKDPNCPLMVSTLEVGGEQLEITLSPNPTASDLYLSIDGDIDLVRNAIVVVADLTGQIVARTMITGNGTTLSTEALPTGIYIVTIQGQSYQHAMKFVKVD